MLVLISHAVLAHLLCWLLINFDTANITTFLQSCKFFFMLYNINTNKFIYYINIY